MKNLREESYYQDLYDHLVVDDCRMLEEAVSKVPPEKVGKMLVRNNLGEYFLWWRKLELGKKRNETVAKWMERDRQRDQFFENATPPKVRCGKCGRKLPPYSNKHLETGGDGKPDRVLFYFKCGSCGEVTAAYDGGEIHEFKRDPCPDCGHPLKSADYEKKSENLYEYAEICDNCGRKEKKTVEFGKYEKEPDPNFEKDRARFCVPAEEATRRWEDATAWIDNARRILDGVKEREEKKPVYDALEKIRRMKIKTVEKYLSEELRKRGYADFRLSKPDISRDILANFTMTDPSNDGNSQSVKKARGVIDELLDDTNWTIMPSSLECRLGIIRGKLRGIDNNDELLKLVERRMMVGKKIAKKSPQN